MDEVNLTVNTHNDYSIIFGQVKLSTTAVISNHTYGYGTVLQLSLGNSYLIFFFLVYRNQMRATEHLLPHRTAKPQRQLHS